MSRKPSKFRKRKREQREHRTLVHVDIETRMVTEKRNGVIKGHYHASEGPLNRQLMAYAHGVGLNKVAVIHGGDLIHGEPRK